MCDSLSYIQTGARNMSYVLWWRCHKIYLTFYGGGAKNHAKTYEVPQICLKSYGGGATKHVSCLIVKVPQNICNSGGATNMS